MKPFIEITRIIKPKERIVLKLELTEYLWAMTTSPTVTNDEKLAQVEKAMNEAVNTIQDVLKDLV